MNLLYEMDCLHLILQDRQVKWICGEMADAARISLENGSTWGEAGNLAEEILLRNTEGKNEEKTVWNMKKMGSLIQVMSLRSHLASLSHFLTVIFICLRRKQEEFYQNLNINFT